jgi:pimeloyl-ACP methyl ester carboxylesterase
MNRSLVVGLIAITLLPLWLVCKERQPDAPRAATVTLGQLEIDAASEFARLAINCIQNEFPNKTGHVLSSSADACYPQALHPAFYGCFDWHSAVHGHWLLVRLLKRFPALPEAKEIRQLLEQNLTQENIAAEVRYFSQPLNRSFERTYGWAWLLKLAEELHDWPDTDAMRWCANLQPLADLLVQRYQDFLPRQTYPIRTGVHPNTAFGLAFAIDYGQAVGDNNFVSLITERSRSYFFADRDYPVDWEPGGEDFFSPALMEADLMRRVLSAQEFSEWFEAFLPALFTDEPLGWLEPAHVSDRSDPKIVHLDGLNLSRAWCLSGIAKKLPAHHPIKGKLLAAAARHAQATLPYISSGQYEGEHWLASFAVYLFREVSLDYPGEVSRYQGFRRYDFLHKGRAAIIVAPDSAADGLPWIWRARFFEHEPQTDLALLHKGFHLVYIDVVDLFGAPQAVAIWNDFYEFLTGRFHFCRKPVLEGLSRGGLIIYNWAIQNPDKVACLYGDAPVCDLKSWPGPERTEMMEAYNFRNQEEFFAYPGNPVDNLAPLAEADVPILHVVGEADQVVPVAENTDVVEERYRKLGGRMHVIRKPGVGHHPHSLTDPTPIVDFILQQVECP